MRAPASGASRGGVSPRDVPRVPARVGRPSGGTARRPRLLKQPLISGKHAAICIGMPCHAAPARLIIVRGLSAASHHPHNLPPPPLQRLFSHLSRQRALASSEPARVSLSAPFTPPGRQHDASACARAPGAQDACQGAARAGLRAAGDDEVRVARGEGAGLPAAAPAGLAPAAASVGGPRGHGVPTSLLWSAGVPAVVRPVPYLSRVPLCRVLCRGTPPTPVAPTPAVRSRARPAVPADGDDLILMALDIQEDKVRGAGPLRLVAGRRGARQASYPGAVHARGVWA